MDPPAPEGMRPISERDVLKKSSIRPTECIECIERPTQCVELSASRCHPYSVHGNIHNSLKYYGPLPFSVCSYLKMVQDCQKSPDPRVTFDCLPLC